MFLIISIGLIFISSYNRIDNSFFFCYILFTQIKVLVSGDRAVSLNNWTAKQQSLNHVSANFNLLLYTYLKSLIFYCFPC